MGLHLFLPAVYASPHACPTAILPRRIYCGSLGVGGEKAGSKRVLVQCSCECGQSMEGWREEKMVEGDEGRRRVGVRAGVDGYGSSVREGR